MLTIGSLFSGIGGLELGLEAGLLRAGLPARVAWQVEKEEYCRQVLAKHWPEAVRHEDIRQCKDLPYVDIICGGFPCQDISVAGTMQGLEGARSGLFYEAARIIYETKPRYVVLENVAALVNNGMADVLRTLACIGYHARWGVLSAADMGAPHLRKRWFCVAWLAYTEKLHCDAIEYHRTKSKGQKSKFRGDCSSPALGHPCSVGLKKLQPSTFARGVGLIAGADVETKGRRIPFPGVGRDAHGLPGWLDRHRWPAPPGPHQHSYEPARTRPQQQHDKQRLKALGNAVVPACAAVIGEHLAELINGLNLDSQGSP